MYQAFIKISILCLCCVFSGIGFAMDVQPSDKYPPSIPLKFEEGVHYQRLDPKIVANKDIQDLIAEHPDKIEVIEFFSYGCFWCGRLRPIMYEWLKHKPNSVVYYRFPLTWNKKFEVLAKAYYVAAALGKEEALEPDFFSDIQEKHIDLTDEKLLSAFFVRHGVSEKKFQELYHSFSINKEMKKAANMVNGYQISVSPVIIINGPSGSYFLTAKLAGSEQAFPKVIDHVVSIESKKLGG